MTWSFKRPRPAALRLWHWLNALAITGLLATVLLRKTFLSWRANSALIQEKLRLAGTTITPDLAKDIAVGIRTPMWNWHYVLGFSLAGLLVLRLVSALAFERGARTRTLREALSAPVAERRSALHFALVKLGHLAFFLAAAFMAATGALMYFKANLGLAKDTVELIKGLHEPLVWLFAAFAGAHVAGVVAAELRGEPGLVSEMIHGGKPGPVP